MLACAVRARSANRVCHFKWVQKYSTHFRGDIRWCLLRRRIMCNIKIVSTNSIQWRSVENHIKTPHKIEWFFRWRFVCAPRVASQHTKELTQSGDTFFFLERVCASLDVSLSVITVFLYYSVALYYLFFFLHLAFNCFICFYRFIEVLSRFLWPLDLKKESIFTLVDSRGI